MSPLGAVFFVTLIISGIISAGKSYEQIGITLPVWIGINAAVALVFAVIEIRNLVVKSREKTMNSKPNESAGQSDK